MERSLWDIIRSFLLRIFGGHHYDYQKVLEKYGYALTQPMTDLHRLSLMLPYILVKAMKLKVASVMVLDPQAHDYKIHAEDGEECDLDGQTILEDSLLIKELVKRKKEIIFEEEEKTGNAQMMSELKKLGARLVIPAVSENPKFLKPTLLFSINLGKILSGYDFTHEDIRFLRKFINQVATNMEQAFIS